MTGVALLPAQKGLRIHDLRIGPVEGGEGRGVDIGGGDGAVAVGEVTGRAGVTDDDALEAEVVRRAGRGFEAHVGLHPDDDQLLDAESL